MQVKKKLLTRYLMTVIRSTDRQQKTNKKHFDRSTLSMQRAKRGTVKKHFDQLFEVVVNL